MIDNAAPVIDGFTYTTDGILWNTILDEAVYGQAFGHLQMARGFVNRQSAARLEINSALADIACGFTYPDVQKRLLDAIQVSRSLDVTRYLVLAFHEVAKMAERVSDMGWTPAKTTEPR